jgi:hypothetical protein
MMASSLERVARDGDRIALGNDGGDGFDAITTGTNRGD